METDEKSRARREFAKQVLVRLREAGHVAWWAGGCVRDLLLGKTPKDYDVATDARPEQVRALFGPRRTLPVGAAFGVILVHGPPGAGDVEVATFRSEGPYLDGRRPDHVVFCTDVEDARRRDFTINGMFYDPLTDEVRDYVQGREDIQRHVIRAIGDAHARFREDKLRMLRGIRFAAALEFSLDPATREAIVGMSPDILVVSAERIAQELRRMFVDPHRARALELARETGLLQRILPEALAEPLTMARWQFLMQTMRGLEQPAFETVLAALLRGTPGGEPAVRAVCRRLKLSNAETEAAAWLMRQPSLDGAAAWRPSQLKRLLVHPWARELLKLQRAEAAAIGASDAGVAFCQQYLSQTPWEQLDPPPLVTGADLLALGWPSGPEFRDVLTAVRDAQLDGTIATREEALALAISVNKAASRAPSSHEPPAPAGA